MVKEKEQQKKIDLRMTEIIESGCLKEDDGMNKLSNQIHQEFPDYKSGKRAFKQRVEKLVWKKETDAALQEVVRMRLEPEEAFCPIYQYIPLEMVKKRATWHRGISTKRFSKGTAGKTLPGIGRIGLDQDLGDLKKFKMPVSTFDKPFKIEVLDPEKWSVMFLNGSNIGTRHGGDIVGNVSRRALSDANERGDSAIIATNIINLDLKKTAGPPKVGRALTFGDNVNPDLIKDPEYRKIVERILVKYPLNEIIYRTPEELVDDILNGWLKISLKPDGKPEYKGPVYIILGNNENDLIRAAAYWEIRWWTVKKQNELRAELRLVRKARQSAEKKEESDRVNELRQMEDSLLSQLHRTIMSSIATQEWHRFYEHARAVMVRKIEKAIPNAKVIGQDTSFVTIAGKKVEVHIPSHSKVTDRLLANYAVQYGPKNLREKLGPVVVICHPWALQFRMTVREADYDGRRGSTKVFVAPIAIDESYLRKVLKASTSQNHQLARAIFTEGFQSGVLRLHSINGIIDADVLSTPSLESFKEYPRRRNPVYNRSSKYIWAMFGSDAHWGGRAKEFVTCKDSGIRLGMAEAVFEMMRKAGLCKANDMRVHLFVAPDDATQGHHFKARTQPHPHQLPPHKIEKIGSELLQEVRSAKNKEEASKITEKLFQLYTYQIEKRGSDFPLDQILQMMDRNIEVNLDIFRAILKRAQQAHLVVRGVGEFVNPQFGGFDTRNCGVINFGSGNHFERTVEGELAEGPLYAKHLRALLVRMPEWREKTDLLEKLVAAPLYSGESIGWGTLYIPGGHEYGLEIRSTPTKMAGWGDPLLGATRNMPMRGNYARIFNRRLPILSVCGDKHFFAAAITDFAFHHMCGAGTHTDRYGERGFPPNNTGVSFIGLPVDGPDKGPLLIRILPFDVIKDFVEDNPRPFNWENFLPNPA